MGRVTGANVRSLTAAIDKSIDITVKKRVSKKYAEMMVNKINRRGPREFRNAIDQALRQAPRSVDKFTKIANHIDYLKSEIREMDHPKVGSGIKFRIEKGEFRIRILLSPDLFKGVEDQVATDMYYILMGAQDGKMQTSYTEKKAFPLRFTQRPEPIKGKKIRRAKMSSDRFWGYKYIRFAKSIGPFPAWYEWITIAENNALENIQKMYSPYLKGFP